MIEIKHLTKKFKEVVAVNDLTIDFEPGITGLVGHNGAGKSTLFRLIADIYQKDKGKILVNGFDNSDIKAKEQIFFLPDNPHVESNATIDQTFAFYSSLFSLDKEKFTNLYKEMALPSNRKVSNFSKGMRRQLFICIALSSKCPILLMDEAFDGLDPVVLEIIKTEILKEEEKTVVISSHNIASLERLVDRFVILHKGQFRSEGNGTDFGHTFVKFQAMFDKIVEQKDLEDLGLKVISFKKTGSIYNFVCLDEKSKEIIENGLKPKLLEPISIDPDEMITLEMMFAQKEDL